MYIVICVVYTFEVGKEGIEDDIGFLVGKEKWRNCVWHTQFALVEGTIMVGKIRLVLLHLGQEIIRFRLVFNTLGPSYPF